MICPKCNSQNDDKFKFCRKCGAELPKREPEEIKYKNTENTQVTNNLPTKSGNGALIVIIILSGVIAVGGYKMYFSDDSALHQDADANKNNCANTYDERNNIQERYSDSMTEPITEISPADEALTQIQTEEITEMTTDTSAESEYVIYDSDKRYLTRADLASLTKEQLRLARNELYARHGRRFLDEGLQSYFDGCSWYNGYIAPDKFSDSVFNEYEKANKDLIVEVEKEIG